MLLSHIEDFESSDIEHSDEEATLDGLGIEGLVATEALPYISFSLSHRPTAQ